MANPWPDSGILTIVWMVICILAVMLPVVLAVAFVIYFDRKIWAAMQLRRGPNVVGPFGILQSFADGIKLVLKETIVPASANKGVYFIAPVLSFVLAMVAWAVIPWGYAGDVKMVISDINVGILYLFAISSLGVYGIIMSGWASNSRYPFLGGLRSAAQMVSYEVSIGFVLITVLLCVGSLNLSDIVEAQRKIWFFIPLFPMFIIFLISALAETNRPPFDLPEAEAELVAGYQVEYSSMTFAMFWLGEYANILLMCAMTSLAAACGHRAAQLGAGSDLADPQDRVLLLHLLVGEGSSAALSLRPAHAPGMEGFPAHLARRGRGGVGFPGRLRPVAEQGLGARRCRASRAPPRRSSSGSSCRPWR